MVVGGQCGGAAREGEREIKWGEREMMRENRIAVLVFPCVFFNLKL